MEKLEDMIKRTDSLITEVATLKREKQAKERYEKVNDYFKKQYKIRFNTKRWHYIPYYLECTPDEENDEEFKELCDECKKMEIKLKEYDFLQNIIN